MNKACIVLLMIEQQNWKQGINREKYRLFYSGGWYIDYLNIQKGGLRKQASMCVVHVPFLAHIHSDSGHDVHWGREEPNNLN